jgi:DNA-binding transcriptional LysR family regulator
MMVDRLVADDVEAFAVFASHRNFTHAARELHVSQPALHVRIRKLEQVLGGALYLRQGQQLMLTDLGVALAEFANDVRDRAAAFASSLQDGPPARPLRLAAGAGAYLYLLGDVVREFLRRWPGGLRLITANAEDTVARLRDGTADAGVTALAVPPTDLRCDLLCRHSQVLAMRSDHRFARRRSIGLPDLAGEQLVVPPSGRVHRRQLERALLDADVDWQVAVEAEGWDLLVHFVRLGVGTAVINSSVRTPRGVVTVPIRGLPPVRYYTVTRPAHPDDARLDVLRQLLARFVG